MTKEQFIEEAKKCKKKGVDIPKLAKRLGYKTRRSVYELADRLGVDLKKI